MGLFDKLLRTPKQTAPPRAAELSEADRAAADERISEGQRLEDEGRVVEAEAIYRQAVRIAPRYPRAHMNLGNALQKQKRLKEAAEAHIAAIDADAAFAPAYFNLGAVLLALGALPEARRRFEKALELMPEMTAASLQLAELSKREGDLASACRYLERALTVRPQDAQIRTDLGIFLLQAGRIEDAQQAFQEAVRADPQNSTALFSLGRIDVVGFNYARASEYFRRVVEISPANPVPWYDYLLALNLRDDMSPEAIAKEHFRFGDQFAQPEPAAPRARYNGTRPIRVGYVSGDFKLHPAAWFIASVLDYHDPDAFEIFCYSNVTVEDEITEHIRQKPEHWRPIYGRDDDSVVEEIRRDSIDVLVDLSGHTGDGRLGVFARRAAAVQVTWLGYLNTTGLRTMDYRIVDRYTDPVGASERFHTEQLVRMPHSQWCWVPHYDIPLSASASQETRTITFGSFNSLGKVSDACLDLWCEILRRVPDSLLRVYAVVSPVYGEVLLKRLAARGIARSRVTEIGLLPIRDYFRAFDEADIALDTMPYNGATTTLATYWMGVPLVSLPGSRGISRSSYSIAKAAGFEELVAMNEEEYIERNVRLAHDTQARRGLSSQLRARLEASVIMDAERFTRDLEELYRGMLNVAPR